MFEQVPGTQKLTIKHRTLANISGTECTVQYGIEIDKFWRSNTAGTRNSLFNATQYIKFRRTHS